MHGRKTPLGNFGILPKETNSFVVTNNRFNQNLAASSLPYLDPAPIRGRSQLRAPPPYVKLDGESLSAPSELPQVHAFHVDATLERKNAVPDISLYRRGVPRWGEHEKVVKFVGRGEDAERMARKGFVKEMRQHVPTSNHIGLPLVPRHKRRKKKRKDRSEIPHLPRIGAPSPADGEIGDDEDSTDDGGQSIPRALLRVMSKERVVLAAHTTAMFRPKNSLYNVDINAEESVDDVAEAHGKSTTKRKAKSRTKTKASGDHHAGHKSPTLSREPSCEHIKPTHFRERRRSSVLRHGAAVAAAAAAKARVPELMNKFRRAARLLGGQARALKHWQLEYGDETRTVRVFLSSTFRDMMGERNDLVKNTFPELKRFALTRGVVLTEVDLRWGISSEQSQTGLTLQLCLQEIDNCRPYFLCMLGHRYGWIPEYDETAREFQALAEYYSFEYMSAMAGKSATHMEIVHATNNFAETNEDLHTFFYFRSPDAPVYLQHPEFKDKTDDLIDCLEQVREQVRQSIYPFRDYETPADLAQMVELDLKEDISKSFPEVDAANDKLGHAYFATNLSRLHRGRQNYLQLIDEFVDSVEDGNTSTPLVFLGECGCGKSSILGTWAHRFTRKWGASRLLISHFVGNWNSMSTDHAIVCWRLVKGIRDFFLEKDGVDLLPDAIEFDRGLVTVQAVSILSAASQHIQDTNGESVVVIVDGLDKLQNREFALELEWLPPVPKNIRLIVSCLDQDDNPCVEAFRRKRWRRIVKVEPLDETERLDIINTYLQRIGKHMGTHHKSRLARADQCGSPLFLRTLLEELRIISWHENLGNDIRRLLQSKNVVDLYSAVLRRVEHDYEMAFGQGGAAVIKTAMNFLWCSRFGLSETELRDLLSDALQRDDVHTLWAPLFNTLTNLKAIIQQGGLLNLANMHIENVIYHRYCTKRHIRGSEVPTSVAPMGNKRDCSSEISQQARKDLIQYFMRRKGISLDDAGSHGRVLEELLYHQSETGDIQGLLTNLADLQVFQQLFTDDRKHDLFNYWARIEELNIDDEAKADKVYQRKIDEMRRLQGWEYSDAEVVQLLSKKEAFLQEFGMIREITQMSNRFRQLAPTTSIATTTSNDNDNDDNTDNIGINVDVVTDDDAPGGVRAARSRSMHRDSIAAELGKAVQESKMSEAEYLSRHLLKVTDSSTATYKYLDVDETARKEGTEEEESRLQYVALNEFQLAMILHSRNKISEAYLHYRKSYVACKKLRNSDHELQQRIDQFMRKCQAELSLKEKEERPAGTPMSSVSQDSLDPFESATPADRPRGRLLSVNAEPRARRRATFAS